MKSEKVIIIGGGGIARYLAARLEEVGNTIVFFLRGNQSEKSFNSFLEKECPKAVFLAISTLDKGESARDYIISCATRGIPIITCEKGSLAYHADVLHPYMNMIGCSATVGGGTMMLGHVKNKITSYASTEIEVVLNGTLNFIFDEFRKTKRSLEEICSEAVEKGCAEPGHHDFVSLINGELLDVRLKMCVFFNVTMAKGKFLTPEMFNVPQFNRESLALLESGERDYCTIASFSNHRPSGVIDSFGSKFGPGFVGDWYVAGALRSIDSGSSQYSWIPTGVGNAVKISDRYSGSESGYLLTGPGAGHEPTTTAMIADYERLCG